MANNKPDTKKDKKKRKNNCLVPLKTDPQYLSTMRADYMAQFVPKFIREMLQNRIDFNEYGSAIFYSGVLIAQNGVVLGLSEFGAQLLNQLQAYAQNALMDALSYQYYRDNYLAPNINAMAQAGEDTSPLKTQMDFINTKIMMASTTYNVYNDMANGFSQFFATGNAQYVLPVISNNSMYRYKLSEYDLDPVKYVVRQLRGDQRQQRDGNRNNNRRNNGRNDRHNNDRRQ